MIQTPYITETSDLLTAIIPIAVPRNEIQHVMGPGIQEVMSTIASQGLAPIGPWFTHHLRRPTESFEFEISVPIASPVIATGRVQPSRWPATKVARTIYRGPYEGLAEAWGEFMEWLEANGHKRTTDLYERYLSGPESSADPSDWSTELNQPIES